MKRSAGVLFYRRTGGALEVLLIHPGGPYWLRQDRGAWQIPKGELGPDEEPEAAARREAAEELGVTISAELLALGEMQRDQSLDAAQHAAMSVICSMIFNLDVTLTRG